MRVEQMIRETACAAISERSTPVGAEGVQQFDGRRCLHLWEWSLASASNRRQVLLYPQSFRTSGSGLGVRISSRSRSRYNVSAVLDRP